MVIAGLCVSVAYSGIAVILIARRMAVAYAVKLFGHANPGQVRGDCRLRCACQFGYGCHDRTMWAYIFLLLSAALVAIAQQTLP